MKTMVFSSDGRPLEVARAKPAEAARTEGVVPQQRYARVGPRLSIKAGRHAHTRQYRRMRRIVRRPRTIMGRPIRDLRRKANVQELYPRPGAQEFQCMRSVVT